MGRRCSDCGSIGHNSRTCTSYQGNLYNASISSNSNSSSIGFRLFGVQIVNISSCSSASISQATDMKSFSMDCLPNSPSSSSSLVSVTENRNSIGYLSDGLLARAQDRRKGVPWTEEEHRSFLAGLQKLSKGDWRGISRNFVPTRTPTQVASHAQKYFLRQVTLDKKKRRSSLFDMESSSSIKQSGATAANQYLGPTSFFNEVPMENNLHLSSLNLSEQEDYIVKRNQEINDECNGNFAKPFGHMDQKTVR